MRLDLAGLLWSARWLFRAAMHFIVFIFITLIKIQCNAGVNEVSCCCCCCCCCCCGLPATSLVLFSLRWLKTVSSTFQDLEFDGRVIITTLYRLMPKSCYQQTAQLSVNKLLLILWHNRLP